MLKSLWVSRAAWAWVAGTTRGWLWPTLRQPTPPTRSMNIRPSTSQNRAPSPRTAKMGACSGIASGTTRALRASRSAVRAPGRAWAFPPLTSLTFFIVSSPDGSALHPLQEHLLAGDLRAAGNRAEVEVHHLRPGGRDQLAQRLPHRLRRGHGGGRQEGAEQDHVGHPRVAQRGRLAHRVDHDDAHVATLRRPIHNE